MKCQLIFAFRTGESTHIEAISASEAIMAITKNQMTPAVPPLNKPK